MKLKDLTPEELLKHATSQDKTIKDLEAAAAAQATECQEHSKVIVEQAEKIVELEGTIAGNGTTIDLQKKSIEELEAKVADHAEQINVLNGIIGNAKNQTSIAQADKKAPAAIPAELVEFNGKKYAWKQSNFRYPGDQTVHNAADVANDKALLAKLLAIPGQKILIEQA